MSDIDFRMVSANFSINETLAIEAKDVCIDAQPLVVSILHFLHLERQLCPILITTNSINDNLGSNTYLSSNTNEAEIKNFLVPNTFNFEFAK